jgi:hypothetical protein
MNLTHKNILRIPLFCIIFSNCGAVEDVASYSVTPLIIALESAAAGQKVAPESVQIPEPVCKSLKDFLYRFKISTPKIFKNRLVANELDSSLYTFVIDFSDPANGSTLEFSVEVKYSCKTGWDVLSD